MDQTVLLTDQIFDDGKRLLDELAIRQFKIAAAFWAMPTEDEKWSLYLVTAEIDTRGRAMAYRAVHDILRQTPDLCIEPLDIRLLDPEDSLAASVMSAIKPKLPTSRFAVSPPKAYPGPTRIGASTHGGISMDAIYIYPLPESVSP